MASLRKRGRDIPPFTRLDTILTHRSVVPRLDYTVRLCCMQYLQRQSKLVVAVVNTSGTRGVDYNYKTILKERSRKCITSLKHEPLD
jgi:hypothetical protein